MREAFKREAQNDEQRKADYSKDIAKLAQETEDKKNEVTNLDKEIEELRRSHNKERRETQDKNNSTINKLDSQIADLVNNLHNHRKDKKLQDDTEASLK